MPPRYEDEVDTIAHFFEFFYNIDTLVELSQGDIQDNLFDDVLVSGLQIYVTSYPSLIEANPDGMSSFNTLIDTMKQLTYTSLTLIQHQQV